MAKCILLARVSTEKQTLEQQTDDLRKEAHNLGYQDLIVIEDKESAISLDEQERHGLNKLKEHIEAGGVECVICYEVSRISRRPKVLYSIRDFLIEKNIQLIILKPYMRLMDNDGKISQSANIMFSLFSALSESEMMIKKERMKRGKRHKMSENKYGGGHITFGYKIDENNNIVIDEEHAKLVIKIFNLYIAGYSEGKIAKDLLETGEIVFDKFENAKAFIGSTLRRKQYYGDSSKVGYNYPQILSKELYDKCREIARLNIRRPKTKNSIILFGAGILFNGKNNRMLTGCKSTAVYSMVNLSDGTNISVSINCVDSLLYYIIKQKTMFIKDDDKDIQKRYLEEVINNMTMKVKTADVNINDYIKQQDRIERRMIEGKMSETKADKYLDEINDKIAELKNNKDKYIYKKNQAEVSLQNMNDDIFVLNDYNSMNDEQIKNLIDKYIDKVLLYKTTVRGTYDVDVIYKNEMIEQYKFCSQSKYPKFWNEYGEQLDVENLRRIIKKK